MMPGKGGHPHKRFFPSMIESIFPVVDARYKVLPMPNTQCFGLLYEILIVSVQRDLEFALLIIVIHTSFHLNKNNVLQ
jgi:hypothetical protein